MCVCECLRERESVCVYVREYEREDERKIKKKIIYHTRQRDGEGRKEREGGGGEK